MSNTLSLPGGKVDTNHHLEAGEYLPSGPKVNKLTQGIRDAIGENMNRKMEYTPQSGNTLADVAESLGISRNVLAASLMKQSTDAVPSAWIGKEIQYQGGRVTLPSGTEYQVAESHNDEQFVRAA